MNYTVQQGDTITSIAARFNIPTLWLLTANRITDPHAITPGLNLYIPIPHPQPPGHTPPPPAPAPHELLQRIERLEAEVNQLESRVRVLESP
ncbi:MAG: LysM peptidoglycan-binding domain-containing protein [Tumebacillaceae bacterium]